MELIILILGIIVLGFGTIPLLGIITIIPSIICIVLGVRYIKKERKTKKVVVGFISSILSLIFTIIYMVLFAIKLEDLILYDFFVNIAIVFVLGIILCYKASRMLNLDKLKKETILQNPFYVRHITGLDIGLDILCTITFTNLNIVISRIKDNKTLKVFNIRNDKVLSVEEDTIVERRLASGDAVGNALLGGILLGSTGAIVGAISGSTVRNVKKDIDVIKIKYMDFNGNKKLILFSCEDKRSYNKFIKKYNKYILKRENFEIEKIEL